MDIFTEGQKIYSRINGADNILIVTHQNPDADALGSMAAFSHWFNMLGKKHTKFCLNQPADNLAWIVDFEDLVTDFNEVLKQEYDLVLVLDSGDLKYAGVKDGFKKLSKKLFLINIDHHFTNDHFGDINLVDDKAVSTTEIVYKLFKALNIKIYPKVANVLLSGIIGDTYNFTNPNTNNQSLEIASSLLLSGARLDQVNDSIFKNKTIDILKTWGEILVRLRYNPQLEIATTVVTSDNLQGILFSADVTEGIANFLNNITGVKAALILQQLEDNNIKGSLRTNNDLIDVAKLATILGGGGHRKAAGFKIKGKLVEQDGTWKVV